jgi:hypothetical protein
MDSLLPSRQELGLDAQGFDLRDVVVVHLFVADHVQKALVQGFPARP